MHTCMGVVLPGAPGMHTARLVAGQDDTVATVAALGLSIL